MRIEDKVTEAWLEKKKKVAFKGKNPSTQTVWLETGMEDGFRIRISRSGTVTFYFRYRRSDGRREEIKLGRQTKEFTLKKALAKADVYRGKLADCRDGEIFSPKLTRETIRAGKTLEEIGREFLAWCKLPGADLQPKTIEDYERTINKVLVPKLGKFSLLDKALRVAFRDLLDGMDKRSLAAHTFSTARRMANWAIERELFELNPFTKAIPPKNRPKLKKRRGFFNVGEITLLLQHLKAMIAEPATAPGRRSGAIALMLLTLTGARKSEVTKSKWNEWDLSSRMLRKVMTKTGPEDKPISEVAIQAVQWVKDLPHVHPQWVCPSASGEQPIDHSTVYFVFRRMQERLFRDKDLRIVHDLRRSFITALKRKKVPLVMIAEILRHKTLAVSNYYAQYQDDFAEETLEQSTTWMSEGFRTDPALVPTLPELPRRKPGPKPKTPARLKIHKERPESRYPSKEVLQQMVLQRPVTEIAKELGVSDKAVEKHCKRIGVMKPGRGHWAKKKAGVEVGTPDMSAGFKQ